MKSDRQANYDAYMQSPEWAARKQALFRSAGGKPKCYCCNRTHSDRRPLDAHHVTYANFGNEQTDDLLLVCRICHDMIHAGAMAVCRDLREATTLVRKMRLGGQSTPPEWRSHALKAKAQARKWRKGNRPKTG